MSAPVVTIEVIKVPAGEAPEEIGQAFVGIKMPAERLEKVSGVRGVVSKRFAPNCGPSYAVSIQDAFEALRNAGKPNVADWLRDHAIPSFDTIVFRAEECRELTPA
ncbi:MAG: hypothetical protein HYS52_01335 [Candidatus Wildermuthbacteria bacterium]|nr:hypothetical protein [Candidatus Wildermuthbacteria bacterium]